MTAGIKANVDGSAAIQVGGSDYITISSAGAVTVPQTLAVTGTTTLTGATTAGSLQVSGAATAASLQVGGVATNLYPLVSGTAVASTSGTSIDFTGIPSWVKRITVMISGLSTNGTSDPLVQLGDSGGIENTGYVAGAAVMTGSSAGFSSTAGFPISGSWSASVLFSGIITLALQDATTNTWTASVAGGRTDTSGAFSGGGYKPLSATLDRVRITTVGGANTFDAGTINIMWE
jgi:hypothetical protein